MPSETAAPVLLTSVLPNHVMVLEINRPDARNAINTEVSVAIARAFESAEADPHIRVVVITGAGDQAFCAGADLKQLAAGDSHHDSVVEGWGLGGTRRLLTKPLIAAVNGVAAGGGFEIALTADLIVASEHARFMLPEVKIGIIAGAGGAIRLPRQIPEKIAMELLLTGQPLDAHRAAQLGLVNSVVPFAELRETAMTLAQAVADNAPNAVVATKRLARAINPATASSAHDDWDTNDDVLESVMASEEAREGRSAFLGKRRPNWLTAPANGSE